VKDVFAKIFFGAGRDSAGGAAHRFFGNTLLKAGHLMRPSVVSGTVRGLALQGGQGLAARAFGNDLVASSASRWCTEALPVAGTIEQWAAGGEAVAVRRVGGDPARGSAWLNADCVGHGLTQMVTTTGVLLIAQHGVSHYRRHRFDLDWRLCRLFVQQSPLRQFVVADVSHGIRIPPAT
jgi:hypothetical protein